MAPSATTTIFAAATAFAFLLPLVITSAESASSSSSYTPGKIGDSDVDILEFALNFEFLEAEFFLHGALGHGLAQEAPDLVLRGAPTNGGKQANLTTPVAEIIKSFGAEQVGHLRAIKDTVIGFPKPLIDISPQTFSQIFNRAFSKTLNPSFDPYTSTVNFLLASYILPYVGLTGYVGINPAVISVNASRLLGGLLAVASGQDAVIRTLLYLQKDDEVEPYGFTVAEATAKISELRNELGGTQNADQGLVTLRNGSIVSNILSGDVNGVGFSRSPQQVVQILYGTGDSKKSGGFFPGGANGVIAQTYITNVDKAFRFINQFVLKNRSG